MLLPLCGSEEFDIDVRHLRPPRPARTDLALLQVLDTLPADLQLLPPDKKREPDSAIRLILVETLVLLATTRACRESMRARGVYEVIKRAHKEEKSPKVTEPMVRLVNLLMREEGPDTAIEEVPTADEDTLKPTADTVFVSADGQEVKAAAEEEAEPTEEEEDYVPFQRTPVAQVDSEDEEEMLLEV